MNLSQMQSGSVGGLGTALDELDIQISRLGSRQVHTALTILALMDSISTRLEALKAGGANVKAEEGQFESACGALRRQAAALVREAGGEAGLRAEREKKNPPPQAWWWRLDELLAQKRRTRLLNGLKIAGAVLVVIAALALLYQRFLAPSPQVVASYRAVQTAEGLAQAKNYHQALAAIQQGLAVAPNDPELWVWEGVLYHLQGKEALAGDDFGKAKALAAAAEDFYISRSQVYLKVGQLVAADQDALAATIANPNSDHAFFMLGTVQEAEQKTAAALQSYQRAVDLADMTNDSTIAVEAKVKMGYLMQGSGMAIKTPSPTP